MNEKLMCKYEKLNLEDDLTAPKSLNVVCSCQNCYRGISFRSLSAPSPNHPDHMSIRKCEYHNCWVPESGICEDYTAKPRG